MIRVGDTVPPESAAAWARELLGAWRHFNGEYLDEALRAPQIRLTDSATWHGSWDRELRLISISVRHILGAPWREVLATLRHEMAHQFADEVLRAHDEPPHGPAFRRAAERLRVSPRAAAPHDPAGTARHERLLHRVRKLLALGESPNAHEAEVALQKARHLLVRHELDELDGAAPRRFAVRALGPIKARHQAWEYALGGLLTEFFFVEALWVGAFEPHTLRRGSQLEVYGSDANLAMASHVHGYLAGMLDGLWRGYKRARGLRRDRDRQRYHHGVIRGFRDKLAEQDRRLADRHGLVVRGDPELVRFYRWHNPRIRTISRGGGRSSEAYADGKRDGRRISLRRPLEAGEGGADFGGYLTGGSG